MPIPKPGKSESRKDFMARCMGDSVMTKEFPDAKQRGGVCSTQWDRRGKSNVVGNAKRMPQPRKRETEGDFMQRCILDPASVNEFPEPSDRSAECLKIWDSKAAKRNRLMLRTNAVLRFDPTRTKMLRQAYGRDMSKRFNRIKTWHRKSVIDNDVFGLSPLKPVVLAPQFVSRPPDVPDIIPARLFAFSTDSAKVDEFMVFLFEMVDKGVLEIVPGGPGVTRTITGSTRWQDVYIESAYKKGINRAWNEASKIGLAVPEGPLALDAAFNSPIHADKVGLIYTRAFNELRGVTDTMAQGISRTLANGLASGLGPREMAREMNRVTEVGRKRAILISRTETIRAHHVANINTYKELGVEGVKVQSEWSTAGDDRVCERCEALEGQIFTLDQIEMLIPLHPNCRCIALPVLAEKLKKSAKRAA